MGADQSAEFFWISVDRDDLIGSIKRLSPGRMTISRRKSELHLGLDNGEMMLCIPGAMSRCPATGNWPGLLCTPFIYLHSLTKVPPALNPVMLINFRAAD